MQIIRSFISCGVDQLYGLTSIDTYAASNTKKAKVAAISQELKLVFSKLGDEHVSFIFSDLDTKVKTQANSTRRYGGMTVASLIRSKKWGKLTTSHTFTNPNTNNKVVVWVWTPNKKFWDFVYSGD